MSARSREKSRQLAAHLKENNVTRETGMCPMNCGAVIRNGGRHLLDHLNTCKGRRRGRH